MGRGRRFPGGPAEDSLDCGHLHGSPGVKRTHVESIRVPVFTARCCAEHREECVDQSALARPGEVRHLVHDRLEHLGAYRLSALPQSAFGQSLIQQALGAPVVLQIAHEAGTHTGVSAPVPLKERQGERGLEDSASARIADSAVRSYFVE